MIHMVHAPCDVSRQERALTGLIPSRQGPAGTYRAAPLPAVGRPGARPRRRRGHTPVSDNPTIRGRNDDVFDSDRIRSGHSPPLIGASGIEAGRLSLPILFAGRRPAWFSRSSHVPA